MKQIALFVILAFAAVHSFAMAEEEPTYRKTTLDFGVEFADLGSFEKNLLDFLRTQPIDERSVVEFGCGFGRIALKIVGEIEGVNYICTDLSEEQIDEVNEKACSEFMSYAKNAQLKAFVRDCCSGVEIAPESSANVVVIANVFHFLNPKKALEALANARKILKPNGRLYIMTQTPHFVMHDILNEIKKGKESIASKRAERNKRKKLLENTLGPCSEDMIIQKLPEVQKLDEILLEMCEEHEAVREQEDVVFSPACFSEIFNIYFANGLSFPGYTALRFMQGLVYAEDGSIKPKPHNAMVKPFLFTLTAELFEGMAKPFGFSVVSKKEYNTTRQTAKEVEKGTSLGLILIKSDDESPEELNKLEQQAAYADEERETFHEKHAVKYVSDFPYLRVEGCCRAQDCRKIAGFACPCKQTAYCSEECQRKDWPNHRHTCTSKRKK